MTPLVAKWGEETCPREGCEEISDESIANDCDVSCSEDDGVLDG